MDYHDVIKFYGSPPIAARKLGISRQLLHYWREKGIPIGRQALIQIQTRGRLRAEDQTTVPK